MPGSERELEDWEKEDPDLLNNPELLCREAESLPLPTETAEREVEVAERMKIVRELMLDPDFNICLQQLSETKEVRATKEDAIAVIEHITDKIRAMDVKFQQNCLDLMHEELWDPDCLYKMFSGESYEELAKWKSTLNELLESYNKIKKCIPKDAFEENENSQGAEAEKEQVEFLPQIVRLLEHFVGVINVILK